MSLSPGERLGPYEVLGPIGAGGMGEVYRARDTRLDRTVALKVLPAELATDPGLRVRFEREARAISALAHPNICTLHDVGEQDGRTFLVMEHLVGETLAERLKKGPVPLEQALEIAAQIADALSAAHKQGIIHRDLKPANVMLTKTGARLLDFGLARLSAHGARPAVEVLTSAPTEPELLTARGTIMGTLPYMAPEQVEGKPADARTDLWALGTILYEMLTGERPFRAENPTSLVGAILEREPEPLRERLPLTPPSLERLVRRCLAKDPDDRWDTAHDMADELRWVAEGEAREPPQEGPRRRGRRGLAWALVLFAGGAIAAALVMRLWATPKMPGRRGVTTVSFHLPPDEPLAATAAPPSFALSPDGRSVAYVAAGKSGEHIRIQPLDGSDGATLPETEGARGLFFSPDGDWLCFFAGNRLRKMSLAERRVTTVGDVGGAYGWAAGHWGDDGTIVYASLAGIHAIAAEGGEPPRLIVPSEGDRFHTQPRLLPGGRHVVFTTGPAGLGLSESIAIQPVEGGSARVLVADGAQATYVASGHLVYVTAGALTAVPFDVGRGVLTGAPFELPHEVGHTFRSLFAVSDAGALAYLRPRTNRSLVWVDRSGISSSLLGARAPYQYPRLSPDGETVAVQVASGITPRIWLVDPRRQTSTLLTSEDDGRLPLWTPDGQRVTFSSGRQGGRRVFWQPADGGEAPRLIDAAEDPIHDTDGSWHPDGSVLAHTGYDGDWHILLSRPGSGEAPRRFFQGSKTDFEPRFSPDGNWLAYSSNQSGAWEVYVRSYPDGGGRQQVSVGGGHDPVWARSGREIFYRGDGGLHVVPVTSGSGLAFGQPRLLFEGSYLDTLGAGNYDVSPDGKRFLMVEVPDEERRPTRLEIVLNWFEELDAATSY